MLLELRNRLVINSVCWSNTVCYFERTCNWNKAIVPAGHNAGVLVKDRMLFRGNTLL